MPGVGGDIHFKIDTGADVTVAPEEELPKLGLEKQRKDCLAQGSKD